MIYFHYLALIEYKKIKKHWIYIVLKNKILRHNNYSYSFLNIINWMFWLYWLSEFEKFIKLPDNKIIQTLYYLIHCNAFIYWEFFSLIFSNTFHFVFQIYNFLAFYKKGNRHRLELIILLMSQIISFFNPTILTKCSLCGCQLLWYSSGLFAKYPILFKKKKIWA